MRRLGAVLAVIVLPLVGCGSDEGSGGAIKALKVSADPGGGLRFDARELEAPPGAVEIAMDNPSAVPHAVAIKGGGLDERGETVGKGEVSTVSADLEPGTYSFYCPVGSHEAAGMKGVLRVR